MHDLKEPILKLAHEIHVLATRLETWRNQDRCVFATKQDLDRMECRILMKVSELPSEVTALKNQVIKIAEEQQKRFDAAQARIVELLEQIQNNDPDLPEAVVTGIGEVKTLLQQLDDTIIDTTPPA